MINGSQALALSAAERLIERSELPDDCIYRHHPDATTHSQLGRDFSVVLVNAYQGLNPDNIGRLSGTVIAGGALIIVCPEMSQWADYADPEKSKLVPYPGNISKVSGHYLARWVQLLQNMHGPICVSPDEVPSIATIKPYRIDTQADQIITSDQQAAVDAICKAASGRRKHPAIVTAARGRGKSAALGLAAARLILTQNCKNIIVSSSGLGQLNSVFKHAQAALPGSQISPDGKHLQHAHGSLRFFAADALMAQTVDCDLLLIDEAASLGVFRLLQLLKSYPRLAFSTTEYGYEGSGRGFSIKFRQLIQQYCRGYYQATLLKPIRWREHDPLEIWTNELLMLEADTHTQGLASEIDYAGLEFKQIPRETLVKDEALLKNIFALLVNAHYQTRPVDLRYLLDAPDTQLWAACQNDTPVGLVWLVLEGGLDKNIAIDIVAGRRRPQGHLAPQILGAHLGIDQAITLRCARIQRIVVHPDLQHLGLGSWMLEKIQSQPGSQVDYLASSFGADLPLSRFWMRAGYQVVRLSDKTHAASGLCSALVVAPLSDPAKTMTTLARRYFSNQLLCQLKNGLSNEPVALMLKIAPCLPAPAEMHADDFKAACLFAYVLRPYESSLSALTYLAKILLFSPLLQTELGENKANLYIARLLQNQSWTRCAQYGGLSGKKACVQSLRKSSCTLLERLYTGDRLTEIRAKYYPV